MEEGRGKREKKIELLSLHNRLARLKTSQRRVYRVRYMKRMYLCRAAAVRAAAVFAAVVFEIPGI